MKIHNSLLTGKIAGLICAACFMLLATTVKASFGKETLKFDNLESDSGLPNGYGSLNWADFNTLDALDYELNPSGYLAGMVSPKNVVFTTDGAIYSGQYAFILNSAFLTGAWNDNLQVEIVGYYYNKIVYIKTVTLSAIRPTRVSFPNAIVTEVDFFPFGGTPHEGYEGSGNHVAMDNVTATVLPFPVRSFNLHLED